MAVVRVQIEAAFAEVGIGEQDVLVHSSLSAFGRVEGGAPTVIEALASVCSTILMPAFTYECEVGSAAGSDGAHLDHVDSGAAQAGAMFAPDTPVSREIGAIPEVLRAWPGALRSMHPLQSFVALGPAAEELVGSEDGAYPLGPIRRLAERGGWLALIGVAHTSSTALHLAEHLEGRAPVARYARTPAGIVEVETCGCSVAFDQVEPRVRPIERAVTIGAAHVRAYPVAAYIDAARALLRSDPNALLCGACARCRALAR